MSLQTTDPPMRVRGRYSLGLYRKHDNPVWWFILRGSHRPEETICWILAKQLLRQRVSQEHLLLLDYLGSSSDDTSQLIQRVRRLSSQVTIWDSNLDPDPENRERNVHAYCRRIVRSFRPEMFSYRHWSPQKLPQKRYIGIGYRDHGHLSDAPAWQDQLVNADEESVTRFVGILGTLESLLPPVHPNPKVDSGADESKERTKRRDRTTSGDLRTKLRILLTRKQKEKQ